MVALINKKIDFYIMGIKGLESLKKIVKLRGCGFINRVVSSMDSGVQDDCFDDIQRFCRLHDICFLSRLEAIDKPLAAISVAIGWRWIISNATRLIVFHDSILPKYRGFSPLVNMLINGEKEVGVTAIFATDKYDKGDVIAQEKIRISYPIKIRDAIDKVAVLYGQMLIDVVDKILSTDVIHSVPQNESEASYSLWRNEKDYEVDWSRSAEYIQRFCNAVGYPYMGAESSVENKRVKINEVQIVSDVNIESREDNIGKIIFMENGCPVVVCGKGLLKITSYDFNESISSIRFRSKFEKWTNK